MGYAFEGEDQWILDQFPEGFAGYCIDVGAYDGIDNSNTFLLEKSGWTVLCVEPNPDFETKLRASRKLVHIGAAWSINGRATLHRRLTPNAAGGTAIRPQRDPVFVQEPDETWDQLEVQCVTLDQLIEDYGFPRIDALSVDVEGNEMDVLNGLDWTKWRPKVLVVESWADPGMSGLFLQRKGYTRVERRIVNDMYVRNE